MYVPTIEEVLEEEFSKVYREIREKFRVPRLFKRRYASRRGFVNAIIELYYFVSKLKFKHGFKASISLKMGRVIATANREDNVVVLFVDVYRSFKPKKHLKRYSMRIAEYEV